MQLSPDFFPYFEATAPVLDSDPTLMCVSSWNDHGQASQHVLGGVGWKRPHMQGPAGSAAGRSRGCCCVLRATPALKRCPRLLFEAPGGGLHTHAPASVPNAVFPHPPQDRFVRNATQLYRSDFFPGLGWMLNTRVWGTIRDAWCAGGLSGCARAAGRLRFSAAPAPNTAAA